MKTKTFHARFENHNTTETKTTPQKIYDHLYNTDDHLKRSIIDSLSNSITKQNIRAAFTRLIKKGKATPDHASSLLKITIFKYSHTPDTHLSVIRSLRHLSHRGQ